jgi:hypothetical protein
MVLIRLFCSDENLDSFRSIQFLALIMDKVVEFFIIFPYCYRTGFLYEYISSYKSYKFAAQL